MTEPAALKPCSTCADVAAVKFNIGAIKVYVACFLTSALQSSIIAPYILAIMSHCVIATRANCVLDHNGPGSMMSNSVLELSILLGRNNIIKQKSD